jgi:hypothetical protein
MIQNDIVKQWTDMNKATMEALQQMTKANTETMGSLMQNQFSSKNLGELMKAAMDSAKDFREINSNAFNTLMQKQLSMVDLNTSATAVKQLSEIGSSTMQKFVEQQSAMMTLYMEATASYMEEIKKARTPEDLLGAQTKMMNELQNKMKDNTMMTLQTLEALKSAMTAWSEKTIEQATNS